MSDTIYPNVSEVSISLASAMTLVKSVLTTAIFMPKYQCILFITKYLGDD